MQMNSVSPRSKIHLEHRAGKKVTIITGFHTYGADKLNEIAGELKIFCASGGTIKNGAIEIQGDKVAQIKAYFHKTDLVRKEAPGKEIPNFNQIRITKA